MNKDPYAAKATVRPAVVKSSFKILIGFCQSMGTLVRVKAKLPDELTNTMRQFERLNLDLSIFPSWACFLQSATFLEHLLGFACIPIVSILIMAIPVFWAGWKHSHEVASKTLARFIGSSCLLTVLVYPPVSRVVVSSFNCLDFGDVGSYLNADLRVDCSSASEEFNTIKWLRVLLLIVWPIGALLGIALLMLYYRVPWLASTKMKQARFQAFLKFAESNAQRIGIQFDTSHLTTTLSPEQLQDDALRALICAANSVQITFKPVLHHANNIALPNQM